MRRQSAGCSDKGKAAAASLLTDRREWAWQSRSRRCCSASCWRVPLGGGGGVLCVCVSTSWAAAREFGPRHTPEPACVLGQRSPLARTGSEAFGRGGGRTRGASGICASKPPVSHKVIARLDKYQTPLLSLIRPIARVVRIKQLHSSKPLQR